MKCVHTGVATLSYGEIISPQSWRGGVGDGGGQSSSRNYFLCEIILLCLILTVQLHFCCTCSVESPVASASHITSPQHPDCTGAVWSRQEIWHLSLSRTILIESALMLHIFKRKVCQTERSLAVVSGLCSETGRPDEGGFILSLCCHGSLVASRLFLTSQTLQHKF